MQNGPKAMTSTHRPKSARPFVNRSNAVDIECRPPRVEGLSKRAKKL